MRVLADLHIHSRYSRATSRAITLPALVKWARIKGLNLLGSSDFTHPEWLAELKQSLSEDGSGILRCDSFPFVLSSEISLIYTKQRQRRIHLLLLAPNFAVVDQINAELSKVGRLDYDGRPIFGISAPEAVDALSSISPEIEIIPAHCLTPWYGIFGSASGFDSLSEAFEDRESKIHSLETGLSADPAMIRRISSANNLTLLSNSDAHSFWPWRLGREANIFDLSVLNYKELLSAIRSGNVKTVEVDPAYGKYHFDGHRLCGVSMDPQETSRHNNICPKCGKQLTIGVLHRVAQLADQPALATNFYKLIPLGELIANVLGLTPASKTVWREYNKLTSAHTEFDVLLELPEQELSSLTSAAIARAIELNRAGKIKVKPGFDGIYGKALFETQAKLF